MQPSMDMQQTVMQPSMFPRAPMTCPQQQQPQVPCSLGMPGNLSVPDLSGATPAVPATAPTANMGTMPSMAGPMHQQPAMLPSSPKTQGSTVASAPPAVSPATPPPML